MGNSINIDELERLSRPLLPVIFALDSSLSMEGQPISQLNHCMEEVTSILKDFAATNTAALIKIGILQFHSDAEWVQPKGLEEFDDFVYNPLSAGGLTAMGAAFTELDEKLSREKFLNSTTGHCAPIIIFMTDGEPTDSWEEPLKKLKTNKWYEFAIKIGFAVGKKADALILSKVVGNSEAVIQTDDFNSFRKLLRKVAIQSAMVGSKTHVVGETPDGAKIVKDVLKENTSEIDAHTAKEEGIEVKDPVNKTDWGKDWYN